MEVVHKLIQLRGAPECRFSDSGAEFIHQLLDLWAYHPRTRIEFSRPDKPTDKALMENVNGTLRDEWLIIHCVGSILVAVASLGGSLHSNELCSD